MTTSANIPCEDEKHDGNIRKSTASNNLTINSNNRLLSITSTVYSSGTSHDDDSRL
jgi:hypothetical protein